MYCVSAVRFLDVLGIREWPVYGLVTKGKEGAVTMACMSEAKRIYVFERNVQKFDLTEILQVYHFATFLLRLKEKQKQLVERFKEVRPRNDEELGRKLQQWTMEQANNSASPSSGVVGASATTKSKSPASVDSDKLSLDVSRLSIRY
ncbi:hypothetical protein BC835DRAFT_1285589 [Cytidiella melzeri]|nr:hypothetical protein BC835DRAFT_1285589 [Cytidiella melzeri]